MTAALWSALGAGLLAAAGAWQVQEWRWSGDYKALQLDHAESTNRALRVAAQQGADLQRKKDDALNEAAARARDLANTGAALRTERERLLLDLAAARAGIDAAPIEALRAHAATLNRVFGECTREYSALAERAGGHASDALMFERAWPELPP